MLFDRQHLRHLNDVVQVNTGNSHQSIESWTKHVSGAGALLKLRGDSQLRTRLGRQLLMNLRGQVVSISLSNPLHLVLTGLWITNCIQRETPIPQIVRDLSKAAREFETPEEAALNTLAELSMKYSDIRSSMSCFRDYTNSESRVSALLALDVEYTNWVYQCALKFYNIVNVQRKCDQVYSDHYHVYSSIWVAKVWNHYRCMRILVNRLLIDQISHLLQQTQTNPTISSELTGLYTNQILTSKSMLLQLAHDICASVPYFLGHDEVLDHDLCKLPRTFNGNTLLWPLYSAAVTSIVSPVMRNWIAGRLTLIAEDFGIKQALPLAHSVRNFQNMTDVR
jgi:hypothetical protein